MRLHGVLTVRLCAFLPLTLLLFSCALPTVSFSAQSLAGTHWELLSIQSMDDAQGTTRIAHPERITISFGTDGRLHLRLDCNRGTAGWESTPSADGLSGQLKIGPIAATRAMCSSPQLSSRIEQGLSHVRSYILKDGRLYMSLMADSGIYAWRPARLAVQHTSPAVLGKAPAHDARVHGTPYHAKTVVDCVVGTSAPMHCDLGVIRGTPGNAEVHITKPDGSQRVLLFLGNQVSTQGKVRASRQADLWRIEIDGAEHYTIPEMVITGG